MSNPFNPQEFFQNTAHFASKGRGLFTISPLPAILQNSTDAKIIEGAKMLASGISAKQFSLPDQSLATSTEFSYIGPTRKMPYNQQFNDISVEFLLTNNNYQYSGALYYTLKKWQELIAGPDQTDVDDITSDVTNFGVNYYDKYTTSAMGKILTPTNDESIVIKFSELYPLYVGAITTNWDAEDSPAVLPVQFTFHYSQILRY